MLYDTSAGRRSLTRSLMRPALASYSIPRFSSCFKWALLSGLLQVGSVKLGTQLVPRRTTRSGGRSSCAIETHFKETRSQYHSLELELELCYDDHISEEDVFLAAQLLLQLRALLRATCLLGKHVSEGIVFLVGGNVGRSGHARASGRF